MKLRILIISGLLAALTVSAAQPSVPNITMEVSALAESRPRSEEELSGVAIIGAVNKPGIIDGGEDISVKDALLRAGGMSRLAYRRQVIIFAGEPQSKILLRIPREVDEVHRDLVLSRIILKKGDSLLIPEIMD